MSENSLTASQVQLDSLLRLAQHLADLGVGTGSRCTLTKFTDEPEAAEAWREDRGRCRGKVVGVRWEDGWADAVCERHAQNAEERGALVVRPRRHDGTQAAHSALENVGGAA